MHVPDRILHLRGSRLRRLDDQEELLDANGKCVLDGSWWNTGDAGVECKNPADKALIKAAPKLLRILTRLAEKVRRANSIQHSGGNLTAEDWSELYMLQGEAFAIIAQAELQ